MGQDTETMASAPETPSRSAPLQVPSDRTEALLHFSVVKHYRPQGKLRLHRLSSPISFTCGRCKRQKTAKLVATYRIDGTIFVAMGVTAGFSQERVVKVFTIRCHPTKLTVVCGRGGMNRLE